MVDDIDIKILRLLKYNSKIVVRHLARKIHLSAPATAERIKRLKEQGVIKRYTITVNPEKLGYTRPFFIKINTAYLQERQYLHFINNNQKYILHHYRTTGNFNYMLEGSFRNTYEFNLFLDKLEVFAKYEVIDILDEKF